MMLKPTKSDSATRTPDLLIIGMIINNYLTIEWLGQLPELDVLEPPSEAVRLLEDHHVAESLHIVWSDRLVFAVRDYEFFQAHGD